MLTEFESVRLLGAKILKKARQGQSKAGFDPELLYVECARCHRPLLWEQGETSKLIRRSKIDVSSLNSQCMILSDGCPVCAAGQEGYVAKLVLVVENIEDEKLLVAPGVEV